MSVPVICAACRRSLDICTTMDGVTYRHTVQDPADHPPVPIPAPSGWTEGRCDFCSAESPRFELPARDFRAPYQNMYMSRGNWAACEMCGLLIQAGQWNELVRRATDTFQRRSGVSLRPNEQVLLQTRYRALYRCLRQNTTGPLRPIDPAEGAN